MTVFLVFGGIAFLIAGYFALDWWLAGRKNKRLLTRARDGQVGNLNVDYNIIERPSERQNGTGGL